MLPVPGLSRRQWLAFAALCAASTLTCWPAAAQEADMRFATPGSKWAIHHALPGNGQEGAGTSGIGPQEIDRAGLRRDTYYLLSYQVVTIGILYALPESVSNWSDEQKEDYSLQNWWDNVRNPQWDKDQFYLNYIAHPYWGAAYYVRARERGYGERASFWYSALMSAAFEFGAEALFEQPSIQDIVVTPVAGAILGEYFMRVRDRVAERQVPGEAMALGDRVVLAVTDPIGAINRQVQSWIGAKAEARFYPFIGTQRVRAGGSQSAERLETELVYGLRLDYRW
jgi:hypothetical protein